MLTLDRWREFAVTPKVLRFPKLELIGHDHEPPIIVGAGEVRMDTPESFTFKLSGVPSDIGYALREMNHRKANIYDPLARLRLIGFDDSGRHWSGGWTMPALSAVGNNWIFEGQIENLGTEVEGTEVCEESGAELLFLLRVGDPMALRLARYVRTVAPDGNDLRERELDLLGSKIRFSYEGAAGTLLVTATTSDNLGPPFAENWLSEPLRILFGQLIYPRLVARNFGNGRARVTIRRSPGLIRGAGWAALWEKEKAGDDASFWDTYGRLLSYVALDRDDKGKPNFESNELTRRYEECILAARGSRWVWALTFASTVEGLIKMLQRRDPSLVELAKPSKEEIESIDALVKHIDGWPGSEQLKGIARNVVGRSAEMSATRVLRPLVSKSVITSDQLAAWRAVRHRVMHGELVSIYSTENEDKQLLALASLTYALTRHLLN